ncbi:MAG: HD domain-containing protein [Acidobacteria bacterium]|nr:HD domain-containing protein [Acidobacteriota bacterium]
MSAETILRDLQGAVSASQLYPREHPRLAALVDRVVAEVAGHPEGRAVTVFSVDGEIVVDGQPAKGLDHLAEGLFGLLGRGGYDGLSIGHGIEAEHVHRLLEWLAQARRAPDGTRPPFEPIPHLRLFALDRRTGRPAALGFGTVSADAQPLVDTWHSILEHQECNLDPLESMVLTLARTIERHAGALIPLATLRSHDSYTVTHITNVAILAMALADVVELPAETVTDLGIAAMLHDVGKLRVPPDVLNAPGRLTDEQTALVKRHPEEGARLLLTTPGIPELAAIVAFEHHIQYDGGGYPAVPAGWKTNLASAITMVADVYDALRSDRPYRQGLEAAEIRDIMMKESGTMFAPGLLEAFFGHVVPRTTTVETT